MPTDENPLILEIIWLLREYHPFLKHDRRKNWIYIEIGCRFVLAFFTIGLLFTAISLYLPWFKDPTYSSVVQDHRMPTLIYTTRPGGKNRAILVDAFFTVGWSLPGVFAASKISSNHPADQTLYTAYSTLCANFFLGAGFSFGAAVARVKSADIEWLRWSNVVKRIVRCGRGRKEQHCDD